MSASVPRVDEDQIRADIARRNALRKQAQLPLLDCEIEFTKARVIAQTAVWDAFCATKLADFTSVQAAYGRIDNYGAAQEVHRRFIELILPEWYRWLGQIDYSAITRLTVEGDGGDNDD